MKRNVELLTKVRDLVKLEPEKLDMGLWATVSDVVDFGNGEKAKVSCGTTACIAGWAVQLAGDKLLVDSASYTPVSGVRQYDIQECVARNGRVNCIDVRAQKLLGITSEEADILFLCGDDEAVEILDELIAGRDIIYRYDDDDFDYREDDDL